MWRRLPAARCQAGPVARSAVAVTARPASPCAERALAGLIAAALVVLGACSSTEPALRAGNDLPYLIVDVQKPVQVEGAGLQLQFSLRMSDRTAPPELQAEDVAVINDEVDRDFSARGADGSRSAPRLPADLTLLTVLVLDFSDSIFEGELPRHLGAGIDRYLDALMESSDADSADLRIVKRNHRLAVVQLGKTRSGMRLG